MKQSITLFCLLLLGSTLSAQADYQLFRPDVQYLFDQAPDYSDVEPIYLGMRLGGSECEPTYDMVHIDLDDFCGAIVPSFAGSEVCQSAETTLLYLEATQAIAIQHSAAVGESWIALEEPDRIIYGQVDDISSGTILGGLTDNLKTISFYATSTSGSPLALPTDGSSIVISQSYGLVQSLLFNSFPNDPKELSLVGLSDPPLGLQNADRADFLDQQVGDELHILERDISYFKTEYIEGIYTITSVLFDDVSQIITVGYSGQELQYTYDDYTEAYIDSALIEVTSFWSHDLNELAFLDEQPGTFFPTSVDDTYWYSRESVDLRPDSDCDFVVKVALIPMGLGFSQEGCYGEMYDLHGTGPYYEKRGGPYYRITNTGGSYHRLLQYSKLASGEECGTPYDFSNVVISTVDPRINQLVTLAPNPVTDVLLVALPGYHEPLTAQLYDLQGQRLGAPVSFTSRVPLDVGHLPTGTYVVQLMTDNRPVARRRFVRQ